MKRKLSLILFIFLFFIFITNSCNNDTLRHNPHTLLIHYINVGQGDSTLIQINNKNLLIDSGPKDNRPNLIKYLKSLKIKKIDYVIATHPHDDHIGNMATIIRKYSINKFYAPKISDSSKAYEDMISALKNKKLKINVIKRGTNSINLGQNTKIFVFSPELNNYSNINNYSAVIKLIYKNSSFLFTGDAEKDIEKTLLYNNDNIKSDIIKIGHHGSNTSSSIEFLKKVNPKLAVISVGEDNLFNHPSKKTLKTLKELNIKILRTDINGTITLCSDGFKIYYYNKKEFSGKKLKILFYSSASLVT